MGIINELRQRPPWISEYYVNSIWLESAGIYTTSPNAPLTQPRATADVVIVGGGLTGLATAYHIARTSPAKKIILLEAARCGYGASGRNGGILQDFDNTLLMELYEKKGLRAAQRYFKIDRQGPLLVRQLIKDHRIACDLEESGLLELALTPEDYQKMAVLQRQWEALGIGSQLIDPRQLRRYLISDRYCGGLRKQRAAVLNPAKYALGLKSAIEAMGVAVYECTKVVSIAEGPEITVETEFGRVSCAHLVLATNAYSHKIGYFKNRLFPIGTYILASAPLSDSQLASIGWHGRETMFDTSSECNYFRLTTDNRIVFGGGVSPYFFGNRLSSGNYKPSLRRLRSDFYQTWPQLKDLAITHQWGGTLAMTRDFHPTIGVGGRHKNVFHGVGYSGHGVSWSQLAGKTIAQLYRGEDTPLTRFYCTNRKPPYLPPEPLRKIGFHLYKRYFLDE